MDTFHLVCKKGIGFEVKLKIEEMLASHSNEYLPVFAGFILSNRKYELLDRGLKWDEVSLSRIAFDIFRYVWPLLFDVQTTTITLISGCSFCRVFD